MRILITAVATACLSGPLALPARAQDAVLARDLVRLTEMLPGDYDNQEQVYFEGELNVDPDARHTRLRQLVTRVDSAAGDDPVFVWQRFVDDADTAVARGLWRLRRDDAAGALRMQRWLLPLQADIERAARAPESVGSAQCDVLWRQRAAQFEGQVTGDACDDASLAAGWLLAARELQVPAAGVGIDNGVGAPFVLRRSRPFLCWVAIPKRDGERWHFENQLALHDQGGRAWVETDEAEPQRVGIKMRNVAWPTGTNRDSLVLYVYRGDETAAASYAWGEPTATRLAINLRWMQASCTLDD